MVSTNVLPEYQRLGIGLALMHGVAVPALEAGINQAEFSWVAESNSLSRGSLEKGGRSFRRRIEFTTGIRPAEALSGLLI